MTILNLIDDAWIPVRTATGSCRTIRPEQIAEPGIVALDWPRADLNVAGLELLIGLVYLADPPSGPEDWEERRADPVRLRDRLAPLSPAFNLGGDGARFLQDLEPLTGEVNAPDMLFIDSAGSNTARNNADLMVRRDRYPALEQALAAIALYTLQAHAPSGGAGNRTSMRGGGPMVTLVDPHGSLWDLIWANVPDGMPHGSEALPWMRPTRTSETGQQTFPSIRSPVPAEVFFGMPRRLRLEFEGGLVTGVIQRIHGTNYAGWEHPLTPYYRVKAGSELLPVHPRAGTFGYRNWLGVVAASPGSDLRQRANSVTTYADRAPARARLGARASLIVAGWATDNMKPLDFVLSRQPLMFLDPDRALFLRGMIEAADSLGMALRGALKVVCGDDGSKLESLREEFFARTQTAFEARLAALEAGTETAEIGGDWLKDIRRAALAIFDAEALDGLDQRAIDKARKILAARSWLLGAFNGNGKAGRSAFAALGIEPIEKDLAA